MVGDLLGSPRSFTSLDRDGPLTEVRQHEVLDCAKLVRRLVRDVSLRRHELFSSRIDTTIRGRFDRSHGLLATHRLHSPASILFCSLKTVFLRIRAPCTPARRV